MTDEQQPRAEWVFPEQKKSRKGRVWLIVGLSVVALVIVGVVVLYFAVLRDQTPSPDAGTSPSPTSIGSPSPSSSDSAAPEPEPSTPVETPPPAPEPDMATFVAQVQPRLDDATRGLDLVANNMDVGAQIVDSLQQDAEILAGAAAPSSVVDAWSAAVADYVSHLTDLRSALDNGSDPQAALSASRTSLSELRTVAGL